MHSVGNRARFLALGGLRPVLCILIFVQMYIIRMSAWLAFVFSCVCCVVSQAPGDGDPLCTDEVIDGEANQYFSRRPTYGDNVRPLMDSRDYVVLLQGDEGAHIPWQQVDNDNSNSDVGYTVSVFTRKIQRGHRESTGMCKTRTAGSPGYQQ